MSEPFEFSKTHSMRGRLSDLSPAEFVKLIDGVCLALEEQDLPFHGGVYAANISFDEEGNVGLGSPLSDDTHFTADEIEYVAPELFWDNKRSRRGDVYALGMLMFAWANGGNLPFLYPNATPSDRAEALRRKMSGEYYDIPGICDVLTPVIKKATAFKAEDRYRNVAALHKALQPFREAVEAEDSCSAMEEKLAALKAEKAQEAMMMANILAAAEAAASTVDRNAPKPKKKTSQQAQKKQAPAKKEEKKSMSLRPLVAVLLVAAILMVAAVAMQFGAENTTIDNLEGTNTTPVVPTADPSATPDVTPWVSVTPIVQEDPNGTQTGNEPITVTPTPSPSPVVTIDTSRYSVVKSDLGWSMAAENCMTNGGTLATPRNKDEFAGLTALADRYGLEMVWVGGFRKSGSIVWLSGETSDYIPWANGEPSYRGTNGESENFLMLVKQNGVWAYNDVCDNPVEVYGAAYSGKMGYIMQR